MLGKKLEEFIFNLMNTLSHIREEIGWIREFWESA